MTEEFFQSLQETHRAYVAGYGDPLPPMMELKRIHTAKVVENARLIAAGEGFDANTALLCRAAALLHDTGRYEQLKRYNTFRDSDSVDHAVFSHSIVREKGWLDALEPSEREAVLTAVLVHNRREIPMDGMDETTLAAAKTVRDADKLDIFRVMEDQLANYDWRNDTRAFWNLPVRKAPAPAVVEAILAHRPVDYSLIASLPDFVLIQVGWMVSGLEYPTTRRLCRERGHLEKRRAFLKELVDDTAIDEICNTALKCLES